MSLDFFTIPLVFILVSLPAIALSLIMGTIIDTFSSNKEDKEIDKETKQLYGGILVLSLLLASLLYSFHLPDIL